MGENKFKCFPKGIYTLQGSLSTLRESHKQKTNKKYKKYTDKNILVTLV